MEIVSEKVEDGVATRRFDLTVEGQVVPGLHWLPEGAAGPRPTILFGHGGFQSKEAPNIVAMAESFARDRGWASVALDAPAHGDRRTEEQIQQQEETLRRLRTGGAGARPSRTTRPPVSDGESSREPRMVREWKALLDGLDALPERDEQVRAAIDDKAAAHGWPALHAELSMVDPVTAQRLKPNDAQRIQRALEVWQLTGRPLSQAHGVRALPGLRLPLLSLEPRAREWLHERIAARFHAMLRDGLIDEVRALRARGDLHDSLPSMRCVGYRQVWQALEAGDLSSVVERGIAATRQLAKRQLTWLRSMPAVRVACDDGQAPAQVLAQARQWLATPE